MMVVLMNRIFCCYFIILIFSSGCASYTEETKDMRYFFRSGEYSLALEKLKKTGLEEQNRNRLLAYMEKSMIMDRIGQRTESRKLLGLARKEIDSLMKGNKLGDAASFVYNDSASTYEGEDYEKVSIHTMMAISFLDDNQYDEARVEAKAINTRLHEINSFYKENKNRYAEDAFARYLSGIIYESQGDYDDAIIDYSAALDIYKKSYVKNFDTAVPDDLLISLYRLLKQEERTSKLDVLIKEYPSLPAKLKKDDKKKGDLVVIHELDTITVKTTQEFIIPWDGKPLRMSFPVIRKRYRSLYSKTGVQVEKGEFCSGDLVQNMDAIASATLEDKRVRITAKMLGRLVLKDQISQQAEKNFGIVGKLGASIYGAVTETADTRSWTLLPAAIYVTRVRLDPGSYNVTLFTNGKVGHIKTVSIEKGKIKFLRDVH
ncbi:MAG: hypothetical protein HQK54_03115 [Oligoflexales bacterium]|nr:hypothetical protein [Oligoflexales bacterium]